MRDRAGKPPSQHRRERCSTSDGGGGVSGSDFITINQGTGGDWPQVRPAILGAIMENLHCPARSRNRSTSGTQTRSPRRRASSSARGDADTVATIKELIETRVRPAVANDGGADITSAAQGWRGLSRRWKGLIAGLLSCHLSTAKLKHPASDICCGTI